MEKILKIYEKEGKTGLKNIQYNDLLKELKKINGKAVFGKNKETIVELLEEKILTIIKKRTSHKKENPLYYILTFYINVSKTNKPTLEIKVPSHKTIEEMVSYLFEIINYEKRYYVISKNGYLITNMNSSEHVKSESVKLMDLEVDYRSEMLVSYDFDCDRFLLICDDIVYIDENVDENFNIVDCDDEIIVTKYYTNKIQKYKNANSFHFF
jgi:hypothetical protein